MCIRDSYSNGKWPVYDFHDLPEVIGNHRKPCRHDFPPRLRKEPGKVMAASRGGKPEVMKKKVRQADGEASAGWAAGRIRYIRSFPTPPHILKPCPSLTARI